MYLCGENVGVYGLTGTLVEEISVGDSPTNACFGGAGNDTLFITTKSALYAVKMRVTGAARAKADGQLTKTQVSRLYVALFGRASEGPGNAYWRSNHGHMASAAEAMLGTEAAASYFGFSLEDHRAFIEFIYENTLGKTPSEDPDGIDYWVGELSAGKTRGQVAAALIDAVMDIAHHGTASRNRFINRVTVSNLSADSLTGVANADDLSAYTGLISNVTDDGATVEAARSQVNAMARSDSH